MMSAPPIAVAGENRSLYATQPTMADTSGYVVTTIITRGGPAICRARMKSTYASPWLIAPCPAKFYQPRRGTVRNSRHRPEASA